MDIPILKYIDILLGLAVVMLLGTTVVAAVTQLLLSSLYFRSRTLRKGLQEFIHQLDPLQIDAKDARLIAEIILRHPALARSSGIVGTVLNWLHNRVRRARGLTPLSAANPTDVIQRSELVLLLMEWAANQGAIAAVCRTAVPATRKGRKGKLYHLLARCGLWDEPNADELKKLQEKLSRLMVSNGVGDPSGALQAVRLRAIENERTNPGQPAHVWWNGALMQEAASNLLGKINQGFDNVMARVSQAFKFKAQAIACVISFFVAFSIQLDSLSLVQRLSVDDKLRDSLVKEAEMLTARIEKAEKTPTEATSPADEKARVKQEAEKARAARDEIDASLAFLRQPRFSIIPDTLYWGKLAQGAACPSGGQPAQGTWNGLLQVGPQTYALAVTQPLTVESLEKAIVDAKAPVYTYRIERDRKCLQIVARSPAVPAVSLTLAAAPGSGALALEDVRLDRDREGERRRRPGVMLSWILLSLGTPFWFKLLKNLLSLRSVLAGKDDKERSEREIELKPSEAAPKVQPSSEVKPAKPADDEAGDLEATGAVG